jgi:preprotein translocase subunit SecG
MLMLATVFQTILAFLFVVVGLLMIGIILLQKNRGAGLSGAFGGVGGHSAFGTKTGDFLTWITVGFTATLILLAVVANYAFTPTSSAEALGIDAPPAAPVMPAGMPQPTSPTAQPGGASQTIRIPAQQPPASPQPVSPSPASPAPAPTGAAPSTPPTGGAATPPAPTPTGGGAAKP